MQDMKWAEVPLRYKTVEICGISMGILEIVKQLSIGDGWDVYRIGAMTAAGAFIGYCAGAVIEAVPLLTAHYKEYKSKRFFDETMKRKVVEKKHEDP